MTSDKPVLIEQRCRDGNLFVYVVPCYVARHMKIRMPELRIVQIDLQLIEEAQLVANDV